MRKIVLAIAAAAVALNGCGKDTTRYITDESISQLRLASVSAFTQAQAEIEMIGSDFCVGGSGDLACKKPVPRALVKVLGRELATDLKLAVCLSESQNLEPVADSDSLFARELEAISITYDMECIMYDVSCLESLKLDQGNWRKQLPYREGVPTVQVSKAEAEASRAKLMKIRDDLEQSVRMIVNNLKQSGGDLEIVYGLDDAGKEIVNYLETYIMQPDGPVMPKADQDTFIHDRIFRPYEALFGEPLKLEK
jgi:hypothetical protein